MNVEDTFYHATPLSWAAQKNHADIVLLLIDHGAKSPAMVLMIGAQSGNLEFVKIGLGKGPLDKETLSQALAAAIKKNNAEIVSLLESTARCRRSRLRPSNWSRRFCRVMPVHTPGAAGALSLR